MKKMIEEFVEKHNYFLGKNISYEQYSDIYRKMSRTLGGSRRGIQSLISVNAWTTSADAVHNILYLPSSLQHMHCARLHFTGSATTSPHTHSYVELIYIQKGRLVLNIADKKYTFHEGEICLINTNAIHFEYLFPEEAAIICLGIDDAFFSQYDSVSETDDYTSSLKKLINQKRSEYLYIRFSPANQENTRTVSAIRLLLSELMDDLPGKKRLLIGFTERIIDLLVKEYQINVTKADKEEFHTAIIESVCGYIQKNIQFVTVCDISKQFNYNPDYINRLFKHEKGITISRYIQECRIHRAFELVTATELSMEMISHQVGYHNIGFFYQKFKEYYEATPHHIRQLYKME